MLERQFRRYFAMAERMRGVTGTVLLQLLERRLDNLVYRLGIASSRTQARQFVRHGHILVDGRRVDIPSYLVKPGQEITIAEKAREFKVIRDNLESFAQSGTPMPWLEWKPEQWTGRLLAVPSREDIPTQINEQRIVELYSK